MISATTRLPHGLRKRVRPAWWPWPCFFCGGGPDVCGADWAEHDFGPIRRYEVHVCSDHGDLLYEAIEGVYERER